MDREALERQIHDLTYAKLREAAEEKLQRAT
jgi:hypothetical protein